MHVLSRTGPERLCACVKKGGVLVTRLSSLPPHADTCVRRWGGEVSWILFDHPQRRGSVSNRGPGRAALAGFVLGLGAGVGRARPLPPWLWGLGRHARLSYRPSSDPAESGHLTSWTSLQVCRGQRPRGRLGQAGLARRRLVVQVSSAWRRLGAVGSGGTGCSSPLGVRHVAPAAGGVSLRPVLVGLR